MNYFSYSSLYYFLASFGTMALFIIFLALSVIIFLVIVQWKLFKKAGRNGWESLIPFYSSYVLVKIADLNWWWCLFLIIEFTFKFNFGGFFLSFNIAKVLGNFNCYYNIARKFGKDKSTCILAGLFPTIFSCIFVFSKNDIYDSKIVVSSNGIFGNDTYIYQSTDDVDKNNIKENFDNNEDVKDYNYCSNCGIKLEKSINYCPNCGKKKI